MKSILLAFLLSTFPALAQANGAIPPKAAAALAQAKTVAILNDTNVGAITDGATDALKAWGRYTVTENPDTADLTLRFDKSKDHSGQDSQKTDPSDGQQSYSYNMSFSTSIHMKAYLKDADTPFYTTHTNDSKKKAGSSCINDFRTAVSAAARSARSGPS